MDAALAFLRHGKTDIKRARAKLDKMASQFDEQYFQLREEAGDEFSPEAIEAFRKARAAAALSLALAPDSEDLLESVYEAINASEDPTEPVQAAENALKVS